MTLSSEWSYDNSGYVIIILIIYLRSANITKCRPTLKIIWNNTYNIILRVIVWQFTVCNYYPNYLPQVSQHYQYYPNNSENIWHVL